MTDLSALIVALEGATGPNFDLECRIAEAIGIVTEVSRGPVFPVRKLFGGRTTPLNYTASLDSAMTLVQEGSYGFAFPWFYSEYSKKERNCVVWRAAILKPIWEKATPSLAGDDWFERVETDDAATPALALCIAALKARQASPPPQRSKPRREGVRCEHASISAFGRKYVS